MKDGEANAGTKKQAALEAARLVEDGMVVGIGTGSTMVLVIEELARRTRDEGLRIVGVPTSFQSRILCLKLGIPLREMDDAARVDVALDGADEVDPSLDLIKGGGAAMTREKVVASMAGTFVVVVDESKLVERLGQSFAIPIEVLPSGRSFVERRVRELHGDPALRIGRAKDGPVITDNGQLVYDVRFASTVDLRAVDETLHRTPGVIETGLFFGLASKAIVGCASDGQLTVRTLTRPAAG